MEKLLKKSWHNLSSDEVRRVLEVPKSGLTFLEAKDRLEKFGRNEVPEKNGSRVTAILLNQIKNPLVYILIIAAAIAFVFQDYFDAAIIFAVVILNSAIGFFQEFKAANILEMLKNSISLQATVLREGRLLVIDAKEIAIGDSKGVGIATIAGRYYGMDRDNRWDRTKKSYDSIINAK